MLTRTLSFVLIGVLMTTGAWGQAIIRPEIITQSTTLDHDVTVGIIIARDGVTLNCANHKVSAGPRPAIEVIGRRDVTVRRCFVSESSVGLVIQDSRRSTFERNSVNNNVEGGFRVEGSEGNIFIRNVVQDNGRDGFDLGRSNGNFFAVNSVNGNAVNGIELDFSDHNIFVDNLLLFNGQHGFSLDDSNRNFFSGNTADRNGDTGFNIVRRNDENTFVNNGASDNGVLDADQEESCGNIFQNNRFARSVGIGTIPCM